MVATFPRNRAASFGQQKTRMYTEELNTLSTYSLSPDVLTALLTLIGHGYQIAIVSSDWNARTILRNLWIFRIFDAIIDGSMIQKGKPDPEVYLSAAVALPLSPVLRTATDSAEPGILTAKAGGFCAVATSDTRGHFPAQRDLLDVIP